MNCPCCEDLGIVRIAYREVPDAPHDFAVCRCTRGRWYRATSDAPKQSAAYKVPRWKLWAAREHIAIERMGMLEEFYDDAELLALREDGLAPKVPAASIVASIGRTGREAKL
jgi:hypothetical protein